jgi:hypothetical protein
MEGADCLCLRYINSLYIYIACTVYLYMEGATPVLQHVHTRGDREESGTNGARVCGCVRVVVLETSKSCRELQDQNRRRGRREGSYNGMVFE